MCLTWCVQKKKLYYTIISCLRWAASGSVCWCNSKHCAKCVSCVFTSRDTVKSHIATRTPRTFQTCWVHCWSPCTQLPVVTFLCLFLHFSRLTHSVSSCALHPCAEPRMTPGVWKFPHTSIVWTTNWAEALPTQTVWPAHLCSSLEHLLRTPWGQCPQHQRCLGILFV